MPWNYFIVGEISFFFQVNYSQKNQYRTRLEFLLRDLKIVFLRSALQRFLSAIFAHKYSRNCCLSSKKSCFLSQNSKVQKARCDWQFLGILGRIKIGPKSEWKNNIEKAEDFSEVPNDSYRLKVVICNLRQVKKMQKQPLGVHSHPSQNLNPIPDRRWTIDNQEVKAS